MGDFHIIIKATGGHGCQREIKNGEIVLPCNSVTCPDCQARRLVGSLQKTYNTVNSAELIHWPGQPSEVKDNLLTGIRTGQF